MKWLITSPGREVVLDDQGAEDRLRDDPQRQQDAEERQVPAVGPAEEGENAAAITARPTKPVNILLLNSITAWVLSGGTVLPVALGPVRTAEPRVGQPHARRRSGRSAPEADQRDQRHLRVALWRDLEALAHRSDDDASGLARAAGGTQPPLAFAAGCPSPAEFSIRYSTSCSISFGAQRFCKFSGITLAG